MNLCDSLKLRVERLKVGKNFTKKKKKKKKPSPAMAEASTRRQGPVLRRRGISDDDSGSQDLSQMFA
jgi:hypothetical protein